MTTTAAEPRTGTRDDSLFRERPFRHSRSNAFRDRRHTFRIERNTPFAYSGSCFRDRSSTSKTNLRFSGRLRTAARVRHATIHHGECLLGGLRRTMQPSAVSLYTEVTRVEALLKDPAGFSAERGPIVVRRGFLRIAILPQRSMHP